MKNKLKEIQKWLNYIGEAKLPDYEKLPDVSLYMDQVVTYVKDALEPFTLEEQTSITNFMINNYVKAKIIDAPKNKRYEKKQIAYIISICLLKQVTSMGNLQTLLDKDNSTVKEEDLYTFFKSCEDETLENVLHKTKMRVDAVEKKYKSDLSKAKNNEEMVEKIDSHLNVQLIYIAFKLIVEAQINKFFADKILQEVENKNIK